MTPGAKNVAPLTPAKDAETTPVSSTTPQFDDPVATNITFRLLVFLLLATPGSAKIIRLVDQPEIVQTLYHWSGVLTLRGFNGPVGPHRWGYGVASGAKKMGLGLAKEGAKRRR